MNKKTLDFKVPAMKINQRTSKGKAMYIGVVKAADFIDRANERFTVDYYKRGKNGNSEQGYQRILTPSSVDKIKNFILSETKFPLLPTSLLVSARTKIEYEKKISQFGFLHIKQKLYIIDGQHRFEAWKAMMADASLRSKYGDYEFPVVFLSNFNTEEEVEQFFVVNSRQKKIKTDLAQRNFLRLAAKKETKGLIPQKDMWQLYATKMVDKLNEQISNSVWNGKIGLPNESRELKRTRIINQASFVSSLRPLFIGESAIFNMNTKPQVDMWADFLDDFWKIVEVYYPDTVENHRDYSMMKTVGVSSMHLLLAKIGSMDFNTEQAMTTSAREKILSKVQRHLKSASKRNMPQDFWRSSVPGGEKERGDYAGAYSSAVGHQRLVAKILWNT